MIRVYVTLAIESVISTGTTENSIHGEIPRIKEIFLLKVISIVFVICQTLANPQPIQKPIQFVTYHLKCSKNCNVVKSPIHLKDQLRLVS